MSETKQLPQTVQHSRGQMMSPGDIESMQKMAAVFDAAGMFEISEAEKKRGVTKENKLAQAVVLQIAGKEYGLGQFSSVRNLMLIKGKVVPGYQQLGAWVNSSPRHHYITLQRDRNAAKIEFFRDNKSIGVSEFNTDDMSKAGLGGDMYSKFMANMLFARAMSNGVNAFCPEVVGGPIYTPADFGCVEDDDGNVIEVEDPKKHSDSVTTKTKKGATAGSAPATSKSVSSTGAATIAPTVPSTSSEPLQSASIEDSKSPSSEEPVDVTVEAEEDRGPVPAAIFAQLLEAGMKTGWTQDQCQAWLLKNFSANGVNCEVATAEEIAVQLSWKLVDGAIDYLSTNKPE